MGRLVYHPLGPGNWTITSGWRTARRPGHRGVDIGVWKQPLYAGISGVARRKDQPGGAGYYVEIYSGPFMVSTFHMSRIDIVDRQNVTAGQQIGVSGGVPGEPGAGNTDGAHLHFEIWENGVDTDPAPDLFDVAGAPVPDPPTPPEEDIDMTADELSAMLDEKFKSERNHNYAIRDQAVEAIVEAIVRADNDDEEIITRKRDEMLAVVLPKLDALKDGA